MATPIVYVVCDQNCKFESMTKEQIYAAIMQAVETGEIRDVDAGFVSKVKTINGKYIKFFIGSSDEYEALSEAEKKDGLFAIITNDTSKEELLQLVHDLSEAVEALLESKPETDLAVEKVGKICDENNNLTCKNQFSGDNNYSFISEIVSGWYGVEIIESDQKTKRTAFMYLKATQEITDEENFLSTPFNITYDGSSYSCRCCVYKLGSNWRFIIQRYFSSSWQELPSGYCYGYSLRLLLAE